MALFADATLAHTAFKVSSLAEFRFLHARVVNRGVPVKFVLTTGHLSRFTSMTRMET
jgi:hypothetical protein